MINSRLPFRTARKTSRDGFTLVELLVVIGIIAILAGVALGPITSGIEKAKESSGMQSARSINLLLFSYSNDNNQTYPPGTQSANPNTNVTAGSAGVAILLLQGGYATDPTIFALTGSTKYAGTVAGFTDFGPANIAWDFTGGQGVTYGITSTASDLLPTVFTTGETINFGGANKEVDVTLSGKGPFKNNGMAVAYKSNSAVFMKATNTGGGATVSNFITTSMSDSAQYSQIKSANPAYQ